MHDMQVSNMAIKKWSRIGHNHVCLEYEIRFLITLAVMFFVLILLQATKYVVNLKTWQQSLVPKHYDCPINMNQIMQ